MDEDRFSLTDKKPISVVSAVQRTKVLEDSKCELITKVYGRRWFILILYIVHASLITGQWIEYSIISNIVQRYYNVSALAVDCTSMIMMLFYAIFIFPLTYVTGRLGLRRSIILGSGLCCLGSWIKIFSVSPDGFLITLLGQAVVSLALIVMLPMPGQVSANWFGANEQSTATSLGVFGSQLGVSIWFLLPPIIVKNHDDIKLIGHDLLFMFWIFAIASSIIFVLIIVFFQNEPKLPPSKTRALQKTKKQEASEGFIGPMKRMLTNKSYLLLCNSYGLNVGILNTMATLLNSLYLIHFKNGEEDAGRIGLLIVLTGMFGSIAFGIILDKTQKFKLTTVIVYFLSLCGQVLFAIALLMEVKWMVYAASIFLGFFMSGYLALGYEMAAEYTYPETESNSAGILNLTNNIYGVVLVLILEVVLEHYGDAPVHIIFCLALLIGFVLTVMTKDEHRRQDARKAGTLYHSVPQEDNNVTIKNIS
ncbi:hypothetical protein QAD02_010021 [Eretmocerus hayati]|uniref:Uncharacterized protein n=1 Tax=Eretmocerus hayati TaxID=131215 RepID=A0ACC2NC65_9HYME|nr:hypothetical protein QAD02_010021 [Eretmocerus hayati]